MRSVGIYVSKRSRPVSCAVDDSILLKGSMACHSETGVSSNRIVTDVQLDLALSETNTAPVGSTNSSFKKGG